MRRAELERLDDAGLVRLAQGHEDEALARDAAAALMERYQQRVYHWCRRLVRNHEEALDMAQDALTNAWRELDRFDGRVPFGGWMFVIARNRCLRSLRPRVLLRDEGAELDELAASARGPEQMFEERVSEESVLRLVREHLDPAEQDAIWLRCYEGLSVDDITRMLGLTSASGARGLLQSARRKLRAELARQGMEP